MCPTDISLVIINYIENIQTIKQEKKLRPLWRLQFPNKVLTWHEIRLHEMHLHEVHFMRLVIHLHEMRLHALKVHFHMCI